jgi:hypothetical protein
MTSALGKEREDLLRQIDNQGRRLEKISPAHALDLNVQLGKVAKMLAGWPKKEGK